MTINEFISWFLTDVRFFDIYAEFALGMLLFAYRCERRERFALRVFSCIAVARVLCWIFAYTHNGTIGEEAIFSAIELALLIASYVFCFRESVWNMLFYFGSGFMTWYIADRTFLVIASVCRLNPTLAWLFVEDTLPHMAIYFGTFVLVYTAIYNTIGRQFRRFDNSKIAAPNAILLVLVVCILTPIFYFESALLANYDTVYYIILNVGEIIYYASMLIVQIVMLNSVKEKAEFDTQQKLWLEEQKQYNLVKENIDAINLKCHDLKHQIRTLRESGRVDEKYLAELENSISIYNSAVRTGNETLDVILTDKRLHCASNGIQITCMADGGKLDFMEVMDIYSLFGNALDNAIEYETKLDEAKRFIHVSVKATEKMVSIHLENYFEGALDFVDGIPKTTKKDKTYHGYGMKSIKRIVDKYRGNLFVSADDNLFQLNVLLPIPESRAT